MASSTFHHLPEDKKQRIIKAILHEFMRVPFSQASINKMIQEAQISRGSFYQYFTDKYDCLEEVMGHFNQRMNIFVLSCLKKHEGNVFDTMEDVFDEVSILLKKKETRLFYENLFSDAKLSHHHIHALFLENKDCSSSLADEICLHSLKINQSQLNDFLEILYSVMLQSIRDILVHGNENTAKEKFERKIALLRQAYESEEQYAGT